MNRPTFGGQFNRSGVLLSSRGPAVGASPAGFLLLLVGSFADIVDAALFEQLAEPIRIHFGNR